MTGPQPSTTPKHAFVEIELAVPLARTFTYKWTAERAPEIGDAVAVEFHHRDLIGVVVGASDSSKLDRVLPVGNVLDPVSEDQRFVARAIDRVAVDGHVDLIALAPAFEFFVHVRGQHLAVAMDIAEREFDRRQNGARGLVDDPVGQLDEFAVLDRAHQKILAPKMRTWSSSSPSTRRPSHSPGREVLRCLNSTVTCSPRRMMPR